MKFYKPNRDNEAGFPNHSSDYSVIKVAWLATALVNRSRDMTQTATCSAGLIQTICITNIELVGNSIQMKAQ